MAVGVWTGLAKAPEAKAATATDEKRMAIVNEIYRVVQWSGKRDSMCRTVDAGVPRASCSSQLGSAALYELRRAAAGWGAQIEGRARSGSVSDSLAAALLHAMESHLRHARYTRTVRVDATAAQDYFTVPWPCSFAGGH